MQGQPNQVADIAHVHGQVVMTLCSAWLLQQSCVYHYVACLCVIAQQACTYMFTVLKKGYGFNESAVPNSTLSTVFHQSLNYDYYYYYYYHYHYHYYYDYYYYY